MHPNPMNKQKFTKNIIYIAIITIALALQKFFLIPILTKNLGTELYGVWTNIINTVLLLCAVGSIGMGPTIVRFFSGENDKKKISKDFLLIFIFVFFSTTLLSVLCYLFSSTIALYILQNINYAFLIKISCILIILESWNAIIITLYKALKLFKTYTYIYVSYAIAELFFFWYILSNNLGLISLIIASIILKALLVIVGLSITKLKLGLYMPTTKRIKTYLLYGLPLTLTPFYNWVIRVSDQYIIGFFYGAKQIGIYSLHYSLAFLLFNLTYIALFVLSPTITRFWEENKLQELREFMNFSYKYIMMLLIPSIIGYFVLYDGVIINIATSEFISTNILLLVLALTIIFASIYSLSQNILFLLKKTKIINYITLSGAIFNIILNIILVPYIGILGAAVSTLITFTILMILNLIYTRKHYKFDFMIKTIIKFTIAAIIMGVVIYPFKSINLFSLIIQILLGAIVYFIILYFLKVIKKEEIKFFLILYKKN